MEAEEEEREEEEEEGDDVGKVSGAVMRAVGGNGVPASMARMCCRPCCSAATSLCMEATATDLPMLLPQSSGSSTFTLRTENAWST